MTPELDYDPTGWFVYVLWDRDDEAYPLYIGMSVDFGGRIREHRRKPWSGAIGRAQVYRCDTRNEMRALELRLIRELQPLHNVGDGGTAPATPRKTRDAEDFRASLSALPPDAWLDESAVAQAMGVNCALRGMTASALLRELDARASAPV